MDTAGSKMIESTIAYSLTLRAIGTSRKVPSTEVQHDANPDRIRVSKRILECAEMRTLRKQQLNLRGFIQARSIPYPLKAGIYLLPVDLLEEVDEEVERQRPIQKQLADSLAARVNEIKEADREALGSLYCSTDYMEAGEIRMAFGIDTRYIALDLPNNLRAVSKAVFERERARMKQEIESAGEAVRQIQRAQVKEFVDGLVENLTPKDGKKRSIRKGGALDRMKEFLDRWGQLNVTDDAELGRVVEKAREILSGVDVEALRSEEVLREGTKQNMEKIRELIEPLIQDAPRRRFFGDE